MLSYGRSSPNFSHLRGSELRSSGYAAVNGLCGWTDDLHLCCVFAVGPTSLQIQRVLVAALCQIIVPTPSEVFIPSMVQLQQRLIRMLEVPGVSLPPGIQHVAVTVPMALSICRLRAMWAGGRRLQQRAVRFPKRSPASFLGSSSATRGC